MDDPALSRAIEVARGQAASMLNPIFAAQHHKDVANVLAAFIVDTWEIGPVDRDVAVVMVNRFITSPVVPVREAAAALIDEAVWQRGG